MRMIVEGVVGVVGWVVVGVVGESDAGRFSGVDAGAWLMMMSLH
jgi:hypothetical protein